MTSTSLAKAIFDEIERHSLNREPITLSAIERLVESYWPAPLPDHVIDRHRSVDAGLQALELHKRLGRSDMTVSEIAHAIRTPEIERSPAPESETVMQTTLRNVCAIRGITLLDCIFGRNRMDNLLRIDRGDGTVLSYRAQGTLNAQCRSLAAFVDTIITARKS